MMVNRLKLMMNKKKLKIELITPTSNISDPYALFDQLSDFPSLEELRKQAGQRAYNH